MYSQVGLSINDFPHSVMGGLPTGRQYVIGVEESSGPGQRRTVSFDSVIAPPIGKLVY